MAASPGKHPLRHDPIVTVTPNPALDVGTSASRVMPEHKMRCGPTRLDPGGGGINCQLFAGTKVDPEPRSGDAVTVKGRCTGFLMDVNLADCVLFK